MCDSNNVDSLRLGKMPDLSGQHDFGLSILPLGWICVYERSDVSPLLCYHNLSYRTTVGSGFGSCPERANHSPDRLHTAPLGPASQRSANPLPNAPLARASDRAQSRPRPISRQSYLPLGPRAPGPAHRTGRRSRWRGRLLLLGDHSPLLKEFDRVPPAGQWPVRAPQRHPKAGAPLPGTVALPHDPSRYRRAEPTRPGRRSFGAALSDGRLRAIRFRVGFI
jgi:hypothetical protein